MYRLDGKLEFKKERNGLKTKFSLDAFGRVVEEVQYVDEEIPLRKKTNLYNSFHLIESIDVDGLVTNYSYDAAGRLEWLHKSKAGTSTVRSTQYIYDAMGQIKESREWFGEGVDEYRATIKIYDLFGRVIEERLEDSSGMVIHYSHYEYDISGNRIVEQCGDQITLTEYDVHNNPIKITNGMGHKTHTSYNTNFLNKLGQYVLQTIVTDSMGHQVIDTYDAANRLVETRHLNSFGLLVSKQTVNYDLGGNPCKACDYFVEEGEVKDLVETVTSYDNGQIVSVIEAFGDINQKVTAFKYNEKGQKSQLIKADGSVLRYTYDAFGRLETLQSSDESISYSYEYDLRDEVIAVHDLINGNKTERQYDAFGQLNCEIQANGLCIDYTYDRLGRVKFIKLPDKSGLEYVYNAVDLKEVHRLKNGCRTYAHLLQSYTLAGQVNVAKLAGDNGEVHYYYDQLGRCVNISSDNFQQYIPPEGFDSRGNLREFYTQNEPYQFDYDDLNQIVSEKGHSSQTYQFDSLANRKLKNEEQHTYNLLHQLIQKGDEHFKYDSNGNLKERIKAKRVICYEYDALDRLISIKQGDESVNYAYDAFNRRMAKKLGSKDLSEEQLFLYLAQEEMGKWEAGKLTEFRLLSKGRKNSMVAMELRDELYVPTNDLAGNVVCLADEKGNVVERYRYTAFGECEILDSEGQLCKKSLVGNPWQYAGKRLDEESGLTAFGLRYYDSDLGRWITPDPAGFVDGPNLYAYVHNSPLMNYDQFGLFTWSLHTFCPASWLLFGSPFCDNNETARQLTLEHYWVSDATADQHLEALSMADGDFPTPHYTEQTAVYDLNQSTNPQTNAPYEFRQTNKIFGFCNGVMNNLAGFNENLLHAGKLANHNIIGVHSPSFGLGCDSLRYGLGRMNVATETAQMIANFWRECLLNNPLARICWTCHSRGVVDTRNALLLFPPELRERITIIAVAPGCFIEKHLCGSITHLVSLGDVVPLLDPIGMIRCWDTVNFLMPHPIAPFVDHPFNSPTYSAPLQGLYKNFEDQYR